MFDNLVYKFRNRNSKKNLKKQVEQLSKDLNEKFNDLRKETLGNNSMGWITFSTYSFDGSSSKRKSDDSLRGQINDLRDYLGIDYSDSQLAPKPKEEKK